LDPLRNEIILIFCIRFHQIHRTGDTLKKLIPQIKKYISNHKKTLLQGHSTSGRWTLLGLYFRSS